MKNSLIFSKAASRATAFAATIAMLTISAPSAMALNKTQLERELKLFQTQPLSQYMNTRSPRVQKRGKAKSAFSKQMQQSGNFVKAKNWARVKSGKFKFKQAGRAGMRGNDRPEDLVDSMKFKTLEQMDAAKVREAKLAETPWSDDYWAIKWGILAKRYADPSFRSMVTDWNFLDKFYAENGGAAPTDPAKIAMLSPAEKYDLLVGDTNWTMRKQNVEEGREYWDEYKKVEDWMGICHGWAPAAYMLPRPTKTITVTAADGKTKIPFYPADIKALGSLLWANTDTDDDSRFIGGRCDTKDPKKVTASGRVTDPDCFDTNPGTWHLAVVNQFANNRSFVMDATFDYEVWNQPVTAYSYSFFNPETGQAVDTIEAAKVAMASFTKDKFKKFRSKQAAFVVGVNMNVTYVGENDPTTRETDGPENDNLTMVSYIYDLELNAKGEIIGGEWYKNDHPDFLWTPAPGTRALSNGDAYAKGTWNALTQPFPATWSQPAKRASQYSQPLSKVVDALFAASSKK